MPESLPSSSIRHWLVTGASGLFGHALVRTLIDRGHKVSALRGTHPTGVAGARDISCDIMDARQIQQVVRESGAEIVVHAAGLTNVDECERAPALAQGIHVDGTQSIVSAARDIGARLIYISTDHLWDGTRPLTTETTPPYPINVYARTKLKGETIALESDPSALAIRTNFYGPGRPWRKSFSDWILESLFGGVPLNMLTDAYYTPIALDHLTDYVVRLVELQASGILHVAGSERLSKYDFALLLADAAGLPTSGIRRASLATINFFAPRPKDMSLDTSRVASLLGFAMPTAAQGIATLFARGESAYVQSHHTSIGERANNGRG